MRSFIIFLLSFISVATYSEVIVVNNNLPYKNIGRSVTYFKDGEASLSLSQVIAADHMGAFRQSFSDIFNFGNSSAAYWLRVNYINKTDDQIFLIIDALSIEEIDLYSMAGNSRYQHVHSGSIALPNRNVITDNNYIFNLPETTGNPLVQTVYLRVKANNTLLVPIKLASAQGLIKGLNAMQRVEAICGGVLMAIFLFNISVFIKSKDRAYFYYSVYILALFFFVILYFRGYSYLFGDSFRLFINQYPHLFLSVGAAAGMAFTFSFLNLKTIVPWSENVIKALTVSWIFVFILSALGYKSVCSDISQILSAVTAVTVWSLGVLCYYRGFKPAIYFVIAKTFIWIGAVYIALSISNIFPYHELSFQLAPVGFIFELLMLSLALGDRVKEMRKARIEVHADRLKIQEENLYLVSTQNERLEKVVESRTRSLKKIVQSLEAANADKNRLFSIIAHDLRSPFNSLISLFSLNDMDMLTFDDVKMLLNDSRKNIDNIHNTLNNLLYWAQSQMQGITTAPSRFNMRILINDLMLVYQPLITKKCISTEIIVNDDNDVIADQNQISLVMRNLIDNAIKFTPLQGHITITIWGDGKNVYVDVCNPVAGVVDVDLLTQKERRQPSYGTSNERGVGLGLHLCKDFVEKNMGVLKVTRDGNCVVLRFNLPKFSSPDFALPMNEKVQEGVSV